MDPILPEMSEADLQRNVLELAGYYRWQVFHPYDSRRSTPGWPDLVLCKPPQIIFAELKGPRTRVTMGQERWMSWLRQCGLEVHLWRATDWRAIHSRLASRPRMAA